MRKSLNVLKAISVRFASFFLTFFCAFGVVYLWVSCFQIVTFVPKPHIDTRLLNVTIYQRNLKENCFPVPRPDPLILLVTLDKDKKLRLNAEDYNLENTSGLERKLSEVFRDREENGVFNEEGTKIEKRVFIKVDDSVEYGDFVKIVDALNRIGSDPVYIDPYNKKCTYALGAS